MDYIFLINYEKQVYIPEKKWLLKVNKNTYGLDTYYNIQKYLYNTIDDTKLEIDKEISYIKDYNENESYCLFFLDKYGKNWISFNDIQYSYLNYDDKQRMMNTIPIFEKFIDCFHEFVKNTDFVPLSVFYRNLSEMFHSKNSIYKSWIQTSSVTSFKNNEIKNIGLFLFDKSGKLFLEKTDYGYQIPFFEKKTSQLFLNIQDYFKTTYNKTIHIEPSLVCPLWIKPLSLCLFFVYCPYPLKSIFRPINTIFIKEFSIEKPFKYKFISKISDVDSITERTNDLLFITKYDIDEYLSIFFV